MESNFPVIKQEKKNTKMNTKKKFEQVNFIAHMSCIL